MKINARVWATALVTAGLSALLPSFSGGVPHAHPIVGVQAAPVGTMIDILPYWTNGTGYELTGTHPLATVVEGGDLYRIKFDDPRYWEHWTIPATPSGDFTLVEDTSDPAHRYTFTSPMYPRTMQIGHVYTSAQLSGGAGNLETSYSPVTAGACAGQFQQQFPFSAELVTRLTNVSFGGNLPPVTAIDLRYSYGNGTGGTEYEDNWNALGYGLVQWRQWHYDTLGNQVTDGGPSTFNEMTTNPMTQPDLTVAC